MMKDISNFTKLNPRLIKSLKKYIILITSILLFILFASQLFLLDSYRYSSSMGSRLMHSDINGLNKDELAELNTNLSSLVSFIDQRGTRIRKYEVVVHTSLIFADYGTHTGHNVHFSEDTKSLNMYSGNFKWLFKNELSDRGIYINKIDYEKMDTSKPLRIKVWNSEQLIEVVVDGVYEHYKNNQIFYGSSDYDTIDTVIAHPSIYNSLILDYDYSSAYIMIETENPITDRYLTIFNLYFNEPMTNLKNNDFFYMLNKIFIKVNLLLWVISLTLIVLTFLMIYHFSLELRYTLTTYYLFYASKSSVFFMGLWSMIRIMSMPFIKVFIVFLLLALYIYNRYNYFVSDIFWVLSLIPIFISYAVLLSLQNTSKMSSL